MDVGHGCEVDQGGRDEIERGRTGDVEEGERGYRTLVSKTMGTADEMTSMPEVRWWWLSKPESHKGVEGGTALNRRLCRIGWPH